MAKSRRSPPLILILLVLAALGGGSWWWFGNAADKDPEYTTVVIGKGDVTQVVTATGGIQSVTSIDVSSQISGLVQQVLVDFNDVVKAGQVLAKIDPATYESRLAQAQAQFANTKANHRLVSLNVERTRSLRDQNLVTQSELDTAEAQFEQANAQLLIQQAAVDTARTDLSRCTILSPIDGAVMSRQTDVGKTVAASLNAPTLFVIANDLTRMRIDAAIAESDIGNIALEQLVNFTVDAFPNRQFRGRVTQIRNYAMTQNNVVTYETIIDLHNDDLKLRPGMTANVSIVIAQRIGTIKLPNSALRVRLPEGLLPKETKTAPTAGAANATEAPPAGSGRPASGGGGNRRGGGGNPEQMAKVRALMQEAGIEFTPGSRPAPEALAKLRALALERGIELPAFLGGGDRATAGTPVTRTVYKLAGDNPKNYRPVPVTVKLGISDGTTTEVIEGLNEGDVLITSVSLSGGAVAAAPQGGGANNPFTGGGRGAFGGASGGRGR